MVKRLNSSYWGQGLKSPTSFSYEAVDIKLGEVEQEVTKAMPWVRQAFIASVANYSRNVRTISIQEIVIKGLIKERNRVLRKLCEYTKRGWPERPDVSLDKNICMWTARFSQPFSKWISQCNCSEGDYPTIIQMFWTCERCDIKWIHKLILFWHFPFDSFQCRLYLKALLSVINRKTLINQLSLLFTTSFEPTIIEVK